MATYTYYIGKYIVKMKNDDYFYIYRTKDESNALSCIDWDNMVEIFYGQPDVNVLGWQGGDTCCGMEREFAKWTYDFVEKKVKEIGKITMLNNYSYYEDYEFKGFLFEKFIMENFE